MTPEIKNYLDARFPVEDLLTPAKWAAAIFPGRKYPCLVCRGKGYVRVHAGCLPQRVHFTNYRPVGACGMNSEYKKTNCAACGGLGETTEDVFIAAYQQYVNYLTIQQGERKQTMGQLEYIYKLLDGHPALRKQLNMLLEEAAAVE